MLDESFVVFSYNVPTQSGMSALSILPCVLSPRWNYPYYTYSDTPVISSFGVTFYLMYKGSLITKDVISKYSYVYPYLDI